MGRFMSLYLVGLLRDALNEFGVGLIATRILILGDTSSEGTNVDQCIPVEEIIHRLDQVGSFGVIHDPHSTNYQDELIDLAQECDAALIILAHDNYKHMDLALLKSSLHYPIFIDGCAAFDSQQLERAGFIYKRAKDNF